MWKEEGGKPPTALLASTVSTISIVLAMSQALLHFPFILPCQLLGPPGEPRMSIRQVSEGGYVAPGHKAGSTTRYLIVHTL